MHELVGFRGNGPDRPERSPELPVLSLLFFLSPAKKVAKRFVDIGFGRNPQNSLLFPWFWTKFADFGQNSMNSRPNLKTPLLFSLFLSFG